MTHFKTLALCLILLVAIGQGYAQENMLTTSGAISMALDNNYGIRISRADLEVAGINNNWGTAGRYPTIGFDASAINAYSISDKELTNRFTTGVGLDWIIFDGFRVNITKERLDNFEIASSGQLAVTIENTIEIIVLGYYKVLLEQERLKVLETVMTLSKDRYDYELARKKLGGSVTYNVLQAQNVYLNDKTNFMNQEVIVRNTVRNLNFFIGENPAATWNFSEPFEPDTGRYELSDLFSKMKSSNQILKNQYTNLMIKQSETGLSRSDFYPSVSLSSGIENLYTNSYSSSGSSGNNVLSPYGNIRLSYDIYAAGNRKRNMEIVRINEEVAQVEIEKMEHLLTNEIYNLYDYYEVRIALLNVAEEGLAAAELNMSISEEKYRSGAINSFNFRDIQLIYLNAALQKLQAVYNLIDSRTHLTRITGGFLSQEPE